MAAVYVCAYLVFHKRVSALFESRFMWKNTILSIIILLAVSAFSSIATNAAGLTEQISIYIYGYDMAILLVCLFMLFALFLNENLQTEKQFILQSLQMKNDYYKITKENIEMVMLLSVSMILATTNRSRELCWQNCPNLPNQWQRLSLVMPIN